MDNKVVAFDKPTTIAWEPGQRAEGGAIDFGGWIWRYDVNPAGSGETSVPLTYDWSAVPSAAREVIQFPPFDRQHLVDSLAHLAQLAEDASD